MAKAATAGKSKGGKAPSKSEVLEALTGEISKSIGKKGGGVFQIPGLVKIARQTVPAKPARKNAPDPFNPGQFRDYPAKPASVKVKVRALKNLKSMV